MSVSKETGFCPPYLPHKYYPFWKGAMRSVQVSDFHLNTLQMTKWSDTSILDRLCLETVFACLLMNAKQSLYAFCEWNKNNDDWASTT